MIATLATIPGRERALKKCCESLSSQVTAVLVYDNGRNPDLGDAGKFAAAPERGYHIVCDDDLEYMPGYVNLMIKAIERYQRTSVITLQGRAIHRHLKSFYSDRSGFTKYSLQEPLKEDVLVDVVGSGVMAYHTDTIRFTLKDFPYRNMADLNVSLKCKKEGVPIVCIAHTGKEVRLSPHVDHLRRSIWAEAHKNDAVQTRLVNRIYGIKTSETTA